MTTTITALDAETYAASLPWSPPGGGSWAQQADHFPRPITASMVPFPELWSRVTSEYLKRLGLPIAAAEMRSVHGLPYVSIVPEGRQSAKHPPPWVLRMLVPLVPSLRRSERRLREVFAERPWVDGARRWYDHAAAEARHRMMEATAVDPRGLDDVELAHHVHARARELFRSLEEHLRLHEHDQFPVLLFAVRMSDWGIPATHALGLLAGSSPTSTGASDELEALRMAVDGRPAGSLDELRAMGAEVESRLDAFLQVHGWRVTDGYDVDARCLAEFPSLVVKLATSHPPAPQSSDEEVSRLRASVPASDRHEFDRLLADARLGYGLRDDNSAILVSWPVGLLRRALLAAGERLTARGLLPDPELVIEASPAEVVEALLVRRSLDAVELDRRATHRRELRATDAPSTLGPPEPPAPVGLPGALGVVMRMFEIDVPTSAAGEALRGLGVGAEMYRGRARLVTGSGRGLDAIEPGDVLVATMTSPSYNLVLSLAGALVTEAGDVTSHAAIMARELGLPAVIGASGALAVIRDGDLVTVDPVAGRVTVEACNGSDVSNVDP